MGQLGEELMDMTLSRLEKGQDNSVINELINNLVLRKAGSQTKGTYFNLIQQGYSYGLNWLMGLTELADS